MLTRDRKGKESQYSWENVCIVPGGRAGLIRIAAVLNNAYLGFFIPDYTAYNEMLSLFKNVRCWISLPRGSSTNFSSLLPFPRLLLKPMGTIFIQTRCKSNGDTSKELAD